MSVWDHDWDARIGDGPARAACLDAAARFRSGWDAGQKGERPTDPVGFSWEGAGAAVFLNGGSVHAFAEHAGPVALAFAHLGQGIARAATGTRPAGEGIHAAYEADGYGFGMGLLRTRRVIDGGASIPVPAALATSASHGLGRSLWFVFAGEARPILRFLKRGGNQGVWTGLGLAAVYTAGAPHTERAALADAAGPYSGAFARGMAVGQSLRDGEGRPDPLALSALRS